MRKPVKFPITQRTILQNPISFDRDRSNPPPVSPSVAASIRINDGNSHKKNALSPLDGTMCHRSANLALGYFGSKSICVIRSPHDNWCRIVPKIVRVEPAYSPSARATSFRVPIPAAVPAARGVILPTARDLPTRERQVRLGSSRRQPKWVMFAVILRNCSSSRPSATSPGSNIKM
jgi:hypothetical protein